MIISTACNMGQKESIHTTCKDSVLSGFTLIELSIVLVIIGLIVGGILTGQELIKASEQRATIAQIEKYNTAVNTFRGKYGGLPGDLLQASTSKFWLYTITLTCSNGCGNGNGVIDGIFSTGTYIADEVLVFWRHLSDAQLLDGSYAQNGTTAGTIPASVVASVAPSVNTTASNVGLLLPAAKLGNGNFIVPLYSNGAHYFVISDLYTATIPTAGCTSGQTNNITPLAAYSIDKKIDDGLPGSGAVRAIDITPASFFCSATWSITASTQANCITGSNYNLNPGTNPACSLAMKFN